MLPSAPLIADFPAPPDNITIVGASANLRREAIDIVITVPTFRRPRQLIETLDSLAAQKTAARFGVIVMENDAEGRKGAEAALERLGRDDLAGLVLVAHERGNCSAYNAGWLTALEVFPAFKRLLVIDDDEIAEPNWIASHLEAAERFNADIVGGPQVPIFANASDARWAQHPVFAPPYPASGPVNALYSSGNLNIARPVLEALGPTFLDLRFNFMGGGDSDFLSRAAANGFRLAWCAEARVTEAVPARRTEFSWVRDRSLRNGVISTWVEHKKRAGDPLRRVKVFAKSLALLAASPLRAAMRLAKTGSLAQASYPVLVGLGRVMADLGYAKEQYRNPEAN